MTQNIVPEERLKRYLRATGFNHDNAIRLYGWNIQISESFFPLLNATEVSLRNIISDTLVRLYGDQWWCNADFLDQINDGKGIVKRAQKKIEKNNAATTGKMVAELNFGFWTKMLLPKHQYVFWNDFDAIFDNLPAEISYEDLFDRCDHVCSFRNRIFHHEPIFHKDITQEYSSIMELIRWLNPEKEVWIKQYSRVMSVMRLKP